jgi:hypothetical protein
MVFLGSYTTAAHMSTAVYMMEALHNLTCSTQLSSRSALSLSAEGSVGSKHVG